MTGLEKIIGDIQAESRAAVDGILQAAKQEAEAISKEAEQQTMEEVRQIQAETEKKCAAEAARFQSAAELSRRQKLLAEKQALLSAVLEKALEQAKALPAETYFDTLLSMAVAAAHPGETGEICFGAADLKRLPKDFAAKLQKALPAGTVLQVAAQPVDCQGGFLLNYHGIDENCSFEAILSARRDTLSDQVQAILFAK